MAERGVREGWVEVLEVADPVEAELIRGRLEADGVEVVVEPLSIGEIPVPANEDFAAIRIWVPEGEKDRARRLLERRVLPSELEREAREAGPPGESED